MAQRTEKVQELRRQAMALPLLPGVYIMKDAQNKIIYIGKAKALKNRVSQYFGSDTNHPEKVRQMVAHVDHFDYIVADSEFEALVLECSLIKQYSPKYNILLKDDKGYHYIRISPPPFSKIAEARQKADDGARYLGPYVSSYTVREAVDEACKVFQLPTCNKTFSYGGSRERPCLNHYIEQCCAPCTGKVKEKDYNERLNQAVEFLTQGSTKMVATLQQRMEEAAENLEFEKAARLRDRITAIKKIAQKQKVVMSRVEEQDVIALAQGVDVACFEVFRFTGGSLTDRENFLIEEVDSLPAARAEFIRRYYSIRDRVPPQVTVDGELEDTELLEQWLTDKAGRRVHIVQPQKGEQAHLVEMCRSNAAERIAHREGSGLTGRDAAALDELAKLLGLSAPPAYIESYDISNTGGSDNVAGMVVFENGRPLKAAYRRFLIKTVQGQDDYGSMREVLTRRLTEYEVHKEEGKGFGRPPDLILLDGGISGRGANLFRHGQCLLLIQQDNLSFPFVQQFQTNGVKGADGHGTGRPFISQLNFQSLAHLFSRLVCKGDGSDAGRRNSLFRQPGDPAHQGAGLPRTRSGDNRHRRFPGGNRRQLLRIESGLHFLCRCCRFILF